MHNRLIAIFFTILFMGIICAPSIIIAIDDSIDISLISTSTEEEEKGKENEKSPERFILKKKVDTNFIFVHRNIQIYNYQFKNYQVPHLNLFSPPPEAFI